MKQGTYIKINDLNNVYKLRTWKKDGQKVPQNGIFFSQKNI